LNILLVVLERNIKQITLLSFYPSPPSPTPSVRAGPRHRLGVRPLGPMPLGGLKKIMQGVYVEIFGFLGVYIAKFTKRPEILTRWIIGLKSVNVLGPFDEICYIYPGMTQISIYTLPIKNWFYLIMCQKIIIEKIDDIFLDHLFLIMCLTNIFISDIYYP